MSLQALTDRFAAQASHRRQDTLDARARNGTRLERVQRQPVTALDVAVRAGERGNLTTYYQSGKRGNDLAHLIRQEFRAQARTDRLMASLVPVHGVDGRVIRGAWLRKVEEE